MRAHLYARAHTLKVEVAQHGTVEFQDEMKEKKLKGLVQLALDATQV